MDQRFFDAPIPGENYTTDTRNFPWHRPPEFAMPDDAIEWSIERMLDDEYSQSYMTCLEMGMSITDVATLFCISGIGSGKWSTDVALLIAGPIAHILRIMARGYEIDYEMGYEGQTQPSFKILKEMAEYGDKGVTEELANDMAGEDQPEDADFPTDEMAPSEDMGGLGGLPEEQPTGGFM